MLTTGFLLLSSITSTVKAENDVGGGFWSEIISPVSWSPRRDASTIVLNAKIYTMGGYDYSLLYNDVWSSTDGDMWIKLTTHAGWSSRMAFMCTVFDNKIWVMGGSPDDGSICLNDVWYSSDGIDWTLATEHADWQGRYGATSLAYDGKLWVMGGYYGATDTYFNDVWYSTDGVNWTCATEHADWTARDGLESVVFNNTMHIVGGAYYTDVNDVWSSSDGANWTKICSQINSNVKINFCGVTVYDSKIWTVGGSVSGNPKGYVLYSSDGINFTEVTHTPTWVKRHFFDSIVFNCKMYLLGGDAGDYPIHDLKNDVWYSTDGDTWTNTNPTLSKWGIRGSQKTVIFDNKVWVIGGYHITGLNDVWYSINGYDWVQSTSNAGWSDRESPTCVVYDAKLWLMGGNALNDVWYTTDGVNWTCATEHADWTGRRMTTSLVFDDKMWIMGGYSGSVNLNDVWYSTDGVNWTAESNAGWSIRRAMTSLVYDGKMWVMGGSTTTYANDVYFSSDGHTWTQKTDNAGWSDRNGLESQVYDGKMWVMGGCYGYSGGSLVLNNVYFSTDGLTWTEATADAGWEARYYFSSAVYNNKLWVLGGSGHSTDFNDVWVYNIPSIDNPPNKPTCIFPINNSTGISINSSLKCHIIDVDNDNMNISIYWGNDILIQTFDDAANNSDISTFTLNLNYNTIYSWYVIANDSIKENISDVFTFTTESAPIINHAPNQPTLISPSYLEDDVSINTKLKCHVIDVDADNMTVSFYWFNNATPIETIYNVVNDTDVETSNLSLEYNTSYAWNVIANDSILQNLSNTEGFTTESEPLPENHAPDTPTCVSPYDSETGVSISTTRLIGHVIDSDNDNMTVSFYWDNDELIETINNVENNSNVQTAILSLSYSTCYTWYIVANDSLLDNITDTLGFTTEDEPYVPPENNVPSIINSIPRMFIQEFVTFDNNLFIIWKHDSILISDLKVIFSDLNTSNITIEKFNYTSDLFESTNDSDIITLNDYISIRI